MRYLNYRDALVAALATQTGLPHSRCWAAVNEAAANLSLPQLNDEQSLETAIATVRERLEAGRGEAMPATRTTMVPPVVAYTPPAPFSDLPLKARITISGDSRAWFRDLRAALRDESMQVRARAAAHPATQPYLHELTDIDGLLVARTIAECSTNPDQIHDAALVFERFLDLHQVQHQHAFFVTANDHTSAVTLELIASRFLDPEESRNYSEGLLQSCCRDILGHPNCPEQLAKTLRNALGATYTPHPRHQFGPGPWQFPTAEQVTAATKSAEAALTSDDTKARAEAAADPATPAAALAELTRDRTARVRATVARNAAATTDVLLLLADDEAPLVQIGMAANGGAPPGAVRSARLAKRAHWGRLLDLATWAAGQPLDDTWQEAIVATASDWSGSIAKLLEHLAGRPDS